MRPGYLPERPGPHKTERNYVVMYRIHRNAPKVNTPFFMTIILALLSILFPGWSIQVSRKPRPRQFQHLSYEAALSVSLAHGYNSVNWGAF